MAALQDHSASVTFASTCRRPGDSGESALATENIRKAYELRDRASDNERFFITAYYDGRATGNQEKAQKTCEAWALAYPRNFVPHAMLSGFIYPASARYQQAGDDAEKAIELAPDMAIGYLTLGYSYIYRNLPAEAGKAAQRASERHTEDPFLSILRFDVAFLEDDKAEMARQMALAQGKSGTADWIFDREAFVLANSGHLREARKMSRHAVDYSVEAGHRKGRLYSKPERHCGKRCSGTPPRPERGRWQPFSLPETGRCSTVRRLHWPFQAIPPRHLSS